MTDAQDKPVSAYPIRVLGIVAHNLLKQKMGYRRQANSSPWVTVSHLLNSVGS
jgi:hypothetical protein